MPKPKRRKNLFGFGRKKSSGNYISASGGIAAHSAKPRASKASKPRASKASSSSSSDSYLDEIAHSLAGKSYKNLPASKQATVRDFAARAKVKNSKRRRRNLQVGLPKNQFVNAKVRVKDGKVQIMADESVLGKAGFKAGAGLRGVSASGGVKLNPKRRKNWFGFGKAKTEGIQPGDSVKIIRGGERFWVTVTSVRGSKITGKVDNHLVLKHPFRFGSKISFSKASVIEHQK